MKNLKKVVSIFLSIMLVVALVPSFATQTKAATTSLATLKQQYVHVYNAKDYGLKSKSDAGAVLNAMLKTINKEIAKEEAEESEEDTKDKVTTADSNKDKDTIVVYIPAGNYSMKTTFRVIYPNVYVVADSSAKFTFKKKNVAKPMIEIPAKAPNFALEGGSWDGAGKVRNVISIFKVSNVNISNCTMKNSVDRNVRLDNAKKVVFDKVSVSGAKVHGFSIANKSTVTIKKSKIYSNGEYGIMLNGGSKLDMTNSKSKIYNNKKTGISVTTKNSYINISGCQITKNGLGKSDQGHGIGVCEGSKGTVENNVIKGNKKCGISSDGKNSTLVAKNNTITSNGRHGIAASTGASITAEKNTITGNAWNGIMIRTNSKGTIKSNILSSNKINGLSVFEKSRATVTGNTMKDNKANGFYLVEGSSATAKKNTIIKNKLCGIYTSDATLKITGGNVIKSNKDYDLDKSGSNVKITGKNTIKKIN